MTPGQQQRKDLQDESRRRQQADEKIRELEQEVEQLRNALSSLMASARSVLRAKEPVSPRLWKSLSASISSGRDALDGGGDEHDE